MIVNDSRVRENEIREVGIRVLGHLARFKLGTGLIKILIDSIVFLEKFIPYELHI